ncbi:hypothetical protein EJB05_14804, partial [Eragrostis curvula]
MDSRTKPFPIASSIVAPPPLPDKIVEAILLRVPPDEPALLMRAALACRRWCRIVSSSGFHRRFCARHRRRRPPMLGAVRSSAGDDVVRFISTFSIRLPRTERRGWWALDSRHGRVVLIQSSPRSSRFQIDVGRALAVWDPVTDKLRMLPELSAPPQVTNWSSLNATVVCACAAATGPSSDCDHQLDCPFLVVFLGSDYSGKFAYLYSSKDDAWSEPTNARQYGYVQEHKLVPHVGNSLYFLLTHSTTILEYNLVTRELTAIQPPATRKSGSVVLSAVEGGRLGCVMLAGYTLCIWAREAAGPIGEMIWVQSRVVEQTRLLQDVRSQDNIVPYMAFYTPALGVAPLADDPRDDGASSACNSSS